jgi:Domain of Unknown Function with PDB structure (DUF3857)
MSRPEVVHEVWTDKPVMHAVPPQYANEPAIILKQEVDLNYKHEGRSTNVYYSLHRIVKVLDEKGIEWFNKISIPVSHNTRVPLIKARTILPDGTVKDIPKEMIKVTRNEYGMNEIVFAMEAVEKNAEIEILVNEIRPFSFAGSITYQFDVPVLDASLTMSYPKYYEFEEKGYNGFPTAQEEMKNNRRHISVSQTDIPALHKEPGSFYDVNCERAEYRMTRYINENDVDTNKSMMYSSDDLAKDIHNDNYKLSEKDRNTINTYLSNLGVRADNTEEQNIRMIENGIKTGIVLYPDMYENDADNLDSIISRKAATETGLVKLFAACFTQAQISHELGMAGNRHETRYDPKFDNWGDLDNYVFYFPNSGKYLAPDAVYYRYPFVPDAYVASKGVFNMIPARGKLTGPMSEIRTIAPRPAAETQGNISALVSFDDDMNANVDISYSYTGYMAVGWRRSLLTETKKDEKDLVADVVTIADKKDDIVKYSISNEAADNFYKNKPLEITATVKANDLMERAGTQYLLKAGELIGPQTQLYSDKERKLPVDLDYPHTQNRTITINLPKGYKVMNPDALVFHAEYVDKDLHPTTTFTSGYTITSDKVNGDKLVITVNEMYAQLHFPVTDYERYRNVVNTAADFNKVVLVLDKKGGGVKHAKAKPKAVASK